MEANNQVPQQQQQKESASAALVFNPNDKFWETSMGQNLKKFELQQRRAIVYTNSTIVPKSYQGQAAVGNCIIALDMADRMDLNPLMLMQNLDVIEGRPSFSSKFLIGLVNGCGKYDNIEWDFEDLGKCGQVKYLNKTWNQAQNRSVTTEEIFDGKNIPNIKCTAYAIRKRDGKKLVGTPITVKMAIEQGWYLKKGSKWTSMTDQMLRYRSAAWWVNVYEPGLSMGLNTSEEVRDVQDADFVEIKPERQAEAPVINLSASEVIQGNNAEEQALDTPSSQENQEQHQDDAPKNPADLFGKK